MLTILAKSATSMTQKSGNSLLVLKRGPEENEAQRIHTCYIPENTPSHATLENKTKACRR
jgi:hypothetical protein